MPLKLITPPVLEPIALTEAKMQLKVDTDETEEDDLIARLIVTAREEAEHLTGRSFLPQTWELALDEFCEDILLPRPRLISISAFSYVDLEGVTRQISSDQYILDDFSEPARITPLYRCCWPRARRQANSIRVRYQAGFDDVESVPSAIKDWMHLRIATLFDFRETVVVGSRAVELTTASGLLDKYKVWGA
jgi:uncharacterized phiE125 gp8 family phage protein